MGHSLDHIRSGDEHVRSLVHHHNEIRNRRRIHRASRARTHDRGNLRNHSAVQRVPQKNIRVTGERHHSFLNARAAGVIQSYERRAHFCRQVHDLHNLRRIGLGKRSTKHGEVLSEDEHQASFDPSVAGDESVSVIFLLLHAKIMRTVCDQLIRLLERALIEQKFDSFARAHFALFVLPLATLRSATLFGQAVALF